MVFSQSVDSQKRILKLLEQHHCNVLTASMSCQEFKTQGKYFSNTVQQANMANKSPSVFTQDTQCLINISQTLPQSILSIAADHSTH